MLQGHIEYLGKAGIEPESVDIVVSNCVINLSPDKEKVIQGVYDSLRTGGELYFSDVYADRRLSDEVGGRVVPRTSTGRPAAQRGTDGASAACLDGGA